MVVLEADLETAGKIALITLLCMLVAGTAYAILTSVLTIPSIGTLKTVGVEAYWDPNGTAPVEEIDWGSCTPASIYNKTIYLKNSGTALCGLNLTTANWNPLNASNYIGLSWNYTGQTLQPNEIIPVELTLTISENITNITSFSFDIVITAYEVVS